MDLKKVKKFFYRLFCRLYGHGFTGTCLKCGSEKLEKRFFKGTSKGQVLESKNGLPLWPTTELKSEYEFCKDCGGKMVFTINGHVIVDREIYNSEELAREFNMTLVNF